jgi:hypothetical protein
MSMITIHQETQQYSKPEGNQVWEPFFFLFFRNSQMRLIHRTVAPRA